MTIKHQLIIKLSDISDTDLLQVSKLHIDCINKGFLSSLGVGFIALLYKAIRDSQYGILIIIYEGDEVIGFISGSTNLNKIYKKLIKTNPIKVLFELLPNVISIEKIKKIFEAKQYSKYSNVNSSMPDAELLSIVVRTDYQGKDIANKIFQELVQEFTKKEIYQFKIIVGDDLSRAQNFYIKMGAIESGVLELHKGHKSKIFIYNC